jgi:hypothetical protein
VKIKEKGELGFPFFIDNFPCTIGRKFLIFTLVSELLFNANKGFYSEVSS